MGFMDKLKGVLYEQPEGQSPAQVTASTGLGVASMTTPGGQALSPIASVNADMVSAIKKVTFGRNTAFTQLLAASEALADVIPDQVMRLKAAHKTAGGGRTGRQIAEAVDVHLADVDSEERKFGQMIDGKIASDVGAIEQEARSAQQTVDHGTAEIQQLTQRIAELQVSIGQAQGVVQTAQVQVSQKRQELDGAKNDFKLAANAVRNELNNSKSAIVSTLI